MFITALRRKQRRNAERNDRDCIERADSGSGAERRRRRRYTIAERRLN